MISAFSIVAVFSNLALATWNMNLVTDLIGEDEVKKVIFFFVASFGLLFLMFVIRFCVDDVTPEVREAMERQEACEKYLLLGEVKKIARADTRKKIIKRRETMKRLRSERQAVKKAQSKVEVTVEKMQSVEEE